jgi:serine protease Do
MNFKKFAFTVIVSVVSALGAVMAYQHYFTPTERITYIDNNTPIRRASMAMMNTSSAQPIDFRYAASASTPCVVHVKSTFKTEPVSMRGGRQQDLFGDDFFQFFHGPNPYQRQQEQMATGSGVIVSRDGYVVTNNHVVENASNIEVVLQNNKSYKAKLIGKDPDTDIALLKLDGDNFPQIQFANSDSVLVGEWVLAVGNPFNLASTVTAGIVSAKGRNLNMMGDGDSRSNTAIESFIQTDAAVNPGNSGGALVNINGQLVGINTAIASPTGSYAGYSFAVPSNIVNKIVFDLKQFGTAQRGFLGVTIRTLDDQTAKGLGLDKPEGVYVDGVNKGSAGEEGGLKNKDVIVKINGHAVASSPELQEQVANYRPGDKISVEYIRDGKVQTTQVQLKNKYNTVAAVDNSKDVLNQLGVSVTNLSNQEKAQLGVNSGVKVTDLKDGKLAQFTNMHKGFVITQIDDQPVNNVDDFVNILKEKSGKVMVEGVYPNKQESYLYAFRM